MAKKATDADPKEDAEPISVKEKAETSEENASPEEVVDFSQPCMLGIDEAGRGPVLGPMVYAAAVVPISRKKDLATLGADDSKALKPAQRDALREKLINTPFVRTYEEAISPERLSNQMLQKRKYNLNLIAHDAALSLVEAAIAAGCNVTEVYADTVGPPSTYADKFRQAFPGLKKVDVRKKADSVFKIVGAASIIAKTTRDDILARWVTREAPDLSTVRGSGYPGDEVTKKWLRDSLDPVFGFPSLVRFSWGTAKTMLEKHAVAVEW